VIRYRGRRYGVREVARRARRMRPTVLLHFARDVARGPLRRVDLRSWPIRYGPAALPRVLGFPSRARMLQHLRDEAVAIWPVPPSRRAALADALRASQDGVDGEAKERAEAALAHEVDLLGSGKVELGAEVDWLADFKTGHRWPNQWFREIDYVNWDRPSDVKVPWELSRGQPLVDLARGAVLFGDRRYVDEIQSLIRSWWAANPVGWSVNWSCTMDVAIRATAWTWILSVLADQLDDDFCCELLASLYQHGLFIADNLERSDVNGNHYLSDAVGLVAVGALFRGTSTGEKWLGAGRTILVDEMPRQVYVDGVDHEMSVPYQRLVTELFLVGFLLARAAGRDAPRECWTLLERMGEFIAAYTRPDGSVPVWGDADDGRLLRFGASDVNDHRHLLSTLAVLTGREDLRTAAGGLHEDTLWLLGPESGVGFSRVQPQVDKGSVRVFREGGFAVLRDGDRSHVFFDAGPVGLRGRGGHGHNDALAFELWADGGPLIIDAGAYVYTADPAARNAFRSTAMHNSPMLADVEMAEVGDDRHLWTIADEARAALDDAGEHDGRFFAAGRHHGYFRVAPGALVVRRVELSDAGLDVVDDVPVLDRPWSVTFILHPAVDAAVAEAAPGVRATLTRDRAAWVVDADGDDVNIAVVSSRRSPSYGVVEPTLAVRIGWRGGRLATSIRRGGDGW